MALDAQQMNESFVMADAESNSGAGAEAEADAGGFEIANASSEHFSTTSVDMSVGETENRTETEAAADAGTSVAVAETEVRSSAGGAAPPSQSQLQPARPLAPKVSSPIPTMENTIFEPFHQTFVQMNASAVRLMEEEYFYMPQHLQQQYWQMRIREVCVGFTYNNFLYSV